MHTQSSDRQTVSSLADEWLFDSAAFVFEFAVVGLQKDTLRVLVWLVVAPSAEGGRTVVQPVLC